MLTLLFNIAIFYITFSMIWWGFTSIIYSLVGEVGMREQYMLRLLQYFFITSLTASRVIKYCQDTIGIFYKVIGGLILVTYLLGKANRNMNKLNFQVKINNHEVNNKSEFNKRYEYGLIILSTLFYIAILIYPSLLKMNINMLLDNYITFIDELPIIGWIIKFLGLILVFFMVINGIGLLLIAFLKYRMKFFKVKYDKIEDVDFEIVEEE